MGFISSMSFLFSTESMMSVMPARFAAKEIDFSKQAIAKIVESYTRESGVRQLEKKIVVEGFRVDVVAVAVGFEVL